jgi:hypothetical protein
MDEMLSMSLWIMVAFMTVSGTVAWFAAQSDFPTGLGLVGMDNNVLISPAPYVNVSCEMTSLFEAPGYAVCFLNKLVEPVVGIVSAIWKLLTSWILLLNAIFVSVPAGDLFAGILIPFLGVIEIGAAIVILMRLAAIVRGVAGGFL